MHPCSRVPAIIGFQETQKARPRLHWCSGRAEEPGLLVQWKAEQKQFWVLGAKSNSTKQEDARPLHLRELFPGAEASEQMC